MFQNLLLEKSVLAANLAAEKKGRNNRFKEKVVHTFHVTLGLCYKKQRTKLTFIPGVSGSAHSWCKPTECIKV